MAKHHPVVGKIARKPGYLYFVDAQGNVRQAKRKTGGTKGHRTCTRRTRKRSTR